jgi:hypothetical protein
MQGQPGWVVFRKGKAGVFLSMLILTEGGILTGRTGDFRRDFCGTAFAYQNGKGELGEIGKG